MVSISSCNPIDHETSEVSGLENFEKQSIVVSDIQLLKVPKPPLNLLI